MQTQIDHTKNGEKHHVTTFKYGRNLTFKYARNLLIEEKKETRDGGLIYLKSFEYDFQNRLIKVIDAKYIAEEYLYIDNKLMEKRINYFGIDPGFSACLGNFIFSYEY